MSDMTERHACIYKLATHCLWLHKSGKGCVCVRDQTGSLQGASFCLSKPGEEKSKLQMDSRDSYSHPVEEKGD